MTRKKILLVDDSATALMIELTLLSAGPYELVTARSGEEALTKVRDESPDLILLDVVMPGMDGFEACRRLRADAATRSTPIIMVTTRGEREHVAAGYESGCSDYVTKPLNGHDLLAKVERLLSDEAS